MYLDLKGASSEAPSTIFPQRAREDIDLPTGLLLGGAMLAVLFAWLTPNHYAPWRSFHGELSMAIGGALVGCWMLWRSHARLIRLPLLGVLALFAALIPLAQWFAGLIPFAGDAVLVSLYFLGFAIATWLGFAAASGFGLGRALEPLWSVILVGALASMWLALYQWQGLDYFQYAAIDIVPGTRPYANLIQPNLLATLLVLGTVAVAFLFERARIGRACAVLVVLFLGFGIVLTQSRAGLVEVLVVVALFLWRGRAALSGRLRTGGTLVVAAGFIGMTLAWPYLPQADDARAMSRGVEMTSGGTRPLHWATLLDALGRQPWAGYGWNQINNAQYTAVLDHPPSHETIAHSHDLILDLLITSGVPLGLALALGLAAWFVLAIRRSADPLTLISIAGVVAVFAHALVELPLHYTYMLLPIGMLMGAVSSVVLPGAAIRVPRWLAPALLTLSVAGVALVADDYIKMESIVRQMRFVQARIGNNPAPAPWSARVLTQFSGVWNYSIRTEHAGMTPAEMSEAEVMVRRFPSKENMFRYAAALSLNGRGAEAPAQLQRICAMNPKPGCDWAREVWQAKAKSSPEIAAAPWPAAADAAGAAP